jgi:putative ABC transport system permease protein
MILIFTVISILIAIAGSLALTACTADRRTKDRDPQSPGSGLMNLTDLLTRDLVRLMGIAILIASPRAWFALNKWLQNFYYRITMGWWIFVLGGAAVMGLALILAGFRPWSTARSNPFHALHNESGLFPPQSLDRIDQRCTYSLVADREYSDPGGQQAGQQEHPPG